MIKRALMLALAMALATAAEAQLYKYTDPKTGKTVYSDQPPPDVDTKSVNIRGGSGPATKSAVEQDKALEKGRKEVAEKAKKAATPRSSGAERRALPADEEQLPDLRRRRQDPEAQRAGRARVHDRRGDRGEAREQPPPDGRGVQEALSERRRTALGLALAALAFPAPPSISARSRCSRRSGRISTRASPSRRARGNGSTRPVSRSHPPRPAVDLPGIAAGTLSVERRARFVQPSRAHRHGRE
jgi:hypothetical protein